jgi:hypothetical protein
MSRSLNESMSSEEVDEIARGIYPMKNYDTYGKHIALAVSSVFFDVPNRKTVYDCLNDLAHRSRRSKGEFFQRLVEGILDVYGFHIAKPMDGNDLVARLLFTQEMYDKCFDETGLAKKSTSVARRRVR